MLMIPTIWMKMQNYREDEVPSFYFLLKISIFSAYATQRVIRRSRIASCVAGIIAALTMFTYVIIWAISCILRIKHNDPFHLSFRRLKQWVCWHLLDGETHFWQEYDVIDTKKEYTQSVKKLSFVFHDNAVLKDMDVEVNKITQKKDLYGLALRDYRRKFLSESHDFIRNLSDDEVSKKLKHTIKAMKDKGYPIVIKEA